jgi:hypothetical protein
MQVILLAMKQYGIIWITARVVRERIASWDNILHAGCLTGMTLKRSISQPDGGPGFIRAASVVQYIHVAC